VLGGDASTPSENSGGTVGRLTRKLAPPSLLAEARIVAPCASTIERLMESPRPIPWDLVVKNGSNTCFAVSESIPTPVSDTEIVAQPAFSFPVLTFIRRGAVHGINRVDKQINDHLLQLHRVHQNEW
jgi:hypothetical protein